MSVFGVQEGGKWQELCIKKNFLTVITVPRSFNKPEFASTSAQIGSRSQLKWGSVIEVFDSLHDSWCWYPSF